MYTGPDKRTRRNIRVLEDRDEEGNITPIYIFYGRKKYSVDSVLDIQKRAATKAGGFGLRYTVRLSNEEDGVAGRTTFIFLEKGADPEVWFVEEKQRHACGSVE